MEEKTTAHQRKPWEAAGEHFVVVGSFLALQLLIINIVNMFT
jgi:hypothetical protein